MEQEINKIVTWIEKEVKAANAKGVVIGISGGIDSAVVAALAKKAFPQNALGLWIGIESSRSARRNALRVFQNLELEAISLNLKPTLDEFVKDIFALEIIADGDIVAFEKKINGEKLPRETSYLELPNYNEIIGNIKARLRTAVLYAWAQRNNYLVLNTSNLLEIYVGYYTKWGDGVGDLAPIAHLNKTQIYKMANLLNIPEMVISSTPIADLWSDQKTDEEEMGISYSNIENYLADKELDEGKRVLIENLHEKNKHKLIGLKKVK